MLAAVLFLSLFLCGLQTGAAGRERDSLPARQKELTRHIAALRQEQDFLLFQKTVVAQDSKYLILRIADKTGRLKYKNRVLRDFAALPRSKHLDRVPRGMLVLTEKIEGPRKKRGMIFGNALLIAVTGADPAPEIKLPRLLLSRSDFRSLYAALETGAFLYVLP